MPDVVGTLTLGGDQVLAEGDLKAQVTEMLSELERMRLVLVAIALKLGADPGGGI